MLARTQSTLSRALHPTSASWLNQPGWSVDEILAVHFRMHKAEGALFRDALLHAAAVCGLRLVPVAEKHATTDRNLVQTITALGRSAGPPWSKDQKDATLAALIALRTSASGREPQSSVHGR